MRSLRSTVMLAAAALAISACADHSTGLPTGVAKSGFDVPSAGFDALGYNDVAGIFNGIADGVDKVLDGTYLGDPTYANDRLVMKWNKAWPDGDGAWIMNEWNGQVPGGSGEVWHYKIVRTPAPCGAYGTPLPDGGYCIWNHYEVILSQGTVDNGHFWDAHANPTGFGVSR
ncbi:MAG: hypothetical protein AMXMBFR55_24150 [Gemmatimonadota bacterium]